MGPAGSTTGNRGSVEVRTTMRLEVVLRGGFGEPDLDSGGRVVFTSGLTVEDWDVGEDARAGVALRRDDGWLRRRSCRPHRAWVSGIAFRIAVSTRGMQGQVRRSTPGEMSIVSRLGKSHD
jgi:hypothetical protein